MCLAPFVMVVALSGCGCRGLDTLGTLLTSRLPFLVSELIENAYFSASKARDRSARAVIVAIGLTPPLSVLIQSHQEVSLLTQSSGND